MERVFPAEEVPTKTSQQVEHERIPVEHGKKSVLAQSYKNNSRRGREWPPERRKEIMKYLNEHGKRMTKLFGKKD